MHKKSLQTSFYSLLALAFFTFSSLVLPATIQAQSCRAGYTFSANELKVTFTDSSSAANTYRSLWIFGDGTKGDARNPIHTYKTGGAYRVCLIIRDTVNKCTDTFCETVNVKAACTSNFSFSISGKTVSYIADTTNNKSSASYTWKMGDGNFKTGKTLSYTYASEGQFEVCLTVNDSPCISKICKLVSIGCHAKYVYKADSLTAGFVDQSNTSTNNYTRIWSFGDGKKSDAKNPVHTYAAAGSYKVCLVIKDTVAKCTDTFCETVVITNPTCKSDFTFTLSGKTVTLKADTTNHSSAAKYVWRVETGVFKTGKNLSYTYANDGKYEVCLTIADSPCEAKTCKLVTVGAAKYRISGNIDVDKDPAYPGKVWLIVFKANDSILNAVKDTKIIKDSAGTHYVFEDVLPGTYYVKAALDTTSTKYSDYLPTYFERAIKWANADKIVVSNANLIGRNIHMVKGTNPGGKGFIGGKISQGANKKEGDPISDVEILLLDNSGNPVAYTYSDINGEFSFTDLAWGTYQVYAEVAGLQTFPAVVTISESNQMRDDVSLKMNATTIVTAIEKSNILPGNGMRIYPNPVNSTLNITLDNISPQNVQIKVYSITGKQIMNITKAVSNNSVQLPVNELSNGMYILEVKGRQSQTLMRTNFIKAF